MRHPDLPPGVTNAAWVRIETQLSAAALAGFCEDIERLYRINPYFEFASWQALGENRYQAQLRNLSIGRDFALDIKVDRESPRRFIVRYANGIKRSTAFEVVPAREGSVLSIVDDYDAAGPDENTDEVDRSLHAWGVALREYLQREQRWGRFAPWRWYMRRVWVPMKPAARRITFIILMVTLAEIAFFGLVMAIYWAEHLR